MRNRSKGKILDNANQDQLSDINFSDYTIGRHCRNCGSSLEKIAKFCHNCGSFVPPDDSDKDIDTPEQNIIDGSTCGNCGSLNPEKAKFCQICGRHM